MSKNDLFKCKGCPHRVSTNQLRGSGGVCIHCGTKMHHDNWRGLAVNVAQQLSLSKEEDADFCQLAQSLGLDPNELMRLAILDRLRVWESDLSNKLVNDAMLLEKLYRRT